MPFCGTESDEVRKKGTKEEKEKAYETFFAIDASQNNTWEKIKK